MVDLALLLRSRSAQKQVAHDLRQPSVKRGMRPTQHFRLHAHRSLVCYSTVQYSIHNGCPACSRRQHGNTISLSSPFGVYVEVSPRRRKTADNGEAGVGVCLAQSTLFVDFPHGEADPPPHLPEQGKRKAQGCRVK